MLLCYRKSNRNVIFPVTITVHIKPHIRHIYRRQHNQSLSNISSVSSRSFTVSSQNTRAGWHRSLTIKPCHACRH